jgi:hypothetical protein
VQVGWRNCLSRRYELKLMVGSVFVGAAGRFERAGGSGALQPRSFPPIALSKTITNRQYEIRSMQQKHFFLNLRPLRSLLMLLPPLPLPLITMRCL